MRKTVLQVLAATGFSIAAAGPAQAQNARTWISGTGVDQGGCGPIATPCRSLQYAHDVTNASGEIDVKDSAGYGAVTITKSIAIVGEGSLAGVLATAGNDAITINAGASDTVVLRGLTIEGANVGRNGIVFNGGKALDIAVCTVQNFVGSLPSGNGILVQPVSGTVSVSIVDTTASHNGSAGFFYYPPSGSTASVTIQASRLNTSQNGSSGFAVNRSLAAGGTTKITIFNSFSGNNGGEGFYFNKAGDVAIDLSTGSGNSSTGFKALSGTIMTVGRSTAANNGNVGLYNSGATVSSFGDNRLIGNSAPTSGTIGTVTTQ